MRRLIAFVAAIVCLASSGLCGEDGYVRVHSGGPALNLGPTGLYGSAPKMWKRGPTLNVIVVKRVAFKSPAHGVVLENDVITGVNGKTFPKGKDPRYSLGHAIIDSEAKDGTLRLQLNRSGNSLDATIQLDRIPDYSPTWPMNCKRTDRMLIDACDYLSDQQLPNGMLPSDEGYVGQCQVGLFWLATGDPRYMENARRAVYWYIGWMKDLASKGKNPPWGPWGSSYGALAVAEYYLMTGDRGVLPGLELAAKVIAKGQMPSGSWSHYLYSGLGAGYGEVNNAGMVCFMALLMAKECGVTVDKVALRRAVVFNEKYAPVIQNRYGDHMYDTGQLGYSTMNGKVPGLAVAHHLNGREANSALFALKSARSMDGVEGGHTGHFFNILWTPIATSLAPATEARRAMDQIGWYYALSRTWRGAIHCQDAGKYKSANMTTAGIGLGLASWKRHLRIHGAPKSVFLATLPAELEAAKKLHQANRWNDAIAAVDTFLKKGGLDAETVRLANELRDKARYVKEGADLALTKLEKMAQGGRMKCRAFEITTMLGLLGGLYDKNDPRLITLRNTLPEPWRAIWTRAQRYYDAFALLRDVNTEDWFPYAAMARKVVPDVALPPRDPDWTPIATTAPEAAGRKMLIVQSSADVPEGWTDLAFADKDWKDPNAKAGRGKPAATALRLLRVPFDHGDVTPRQLRLSAKWRKPGLSAGAKVYLNGTLVLNTINGFSNSSVGLLKTTPLLLREGRNMLAIVSSAAAKMPTISLDGALPVPTTSFVWTAVPGQNAEFGKLVAKRGTKRPYYVAATDKRTPEELMKALTAKPYFMPEGFYAIERFKSLKLDPKEQAKYVSMLLKSSTWGARWAGAVLIKHLMTPMDAKTFKRLPKEERLTVTAAQATAGKVCDGFRDQIIDQLKDPHPLVRCQAAIVVAKYGGSARAAIPTLAALVADVDGQTWWTRDKALAAIQAMPVEPATVEATMRAGLSDPASCVRATALRLTFNAKDKDVQAKAAQTYKKEMIQQVFDAPHGMATGRARKTIAQAIVAQLSKDEIRPNLPRFFDALKQPGGGTMVGSMIILASFGDEVVPKLKALVQDKVKTVRGNALKTLHMIAMRDDASPALVKDVTELLKAAAASDDANVADKNMRLLRALEGKKQTDK